jgi:predicted DNA-binding transcriptional regulator AlpA
VDDWVGAAEIAAMFGGISRQRVDQIVARKDFPRPMVRLKQGRVWRTADVVRWAEEKGREIHE